MRIKDIDLVINIMDPSLPLVEGMEVEQHIFFSRTGNVFFMALELADKQGNLRRGRLERMVTDLRSADETVDFLSAFFMEENKAHIGIKKEGSWRVKMTDEEGGQHSFSAPLAEGYLYRGLDVSNFLRAAVPLEGVFGLYGEIMSDRITRIFIELWEGEESSPLYQESLLIERENQVIEVWQKIGEGLKIRHSYHVPEGVNDLLHKLGADSLFRKRMEETDGNRGEIRGVKKYRISVEYEKTEVLNLEGTFNSQGLPADWQDFVDEIGSFIGFYGFGMILQGEKADWQRRRSDEYMFCTVAFEDNTAEESEQYLAFYLSEDDSIRPGDLVLVPTGEEEPTALAKVLEVEFFKEEDLPLSLERLRTIMGRASE